MRIIAFAATVQAPKCATISSLPPGLPALGQRAIAFPQPLLGIATVIIACGKTESLQNNGFARIHLALLRRTCYEEDMTEVLAATLQPAGAR